MAQVVKFTNAVCAPVHWRNMNYSSEILFPGGSCFFLRFSHGLVGITANHVLKAYSIDRNKTPNLLFQVSGISLDIDSAIIDRDEDIDIATFAVSEEQLSIAGIPPIDCRDEWPPPSPEINSVLSLAGFPEELRTIGQNDRVEFRMYSALPMVDSLSETEILVTYDHQRDRAELGAQPAPPPRFNMSGCSGGPVIMHDTRNGLHRWFPAGFIVQGPGIFASGDAKSFEMIRIRRIDCLRNDGNILRRASGWLPPKPFVDPRDQ